MAEADRGPWWASAAVDRPVELTWEPFGLVEADRLIGLAEADKVLVHIARASSSPPRALFLLLPFSTQKTKEDHGDFYTAPLISPSSQPIFSLELLES